jgi:hypothetical protein
MRPKRTEHMLEKNDASLRATDPYNRKAIERAEFDHSSRSGYQYFAPGRTTLLEPFYEFTLSKKRSPKIEAFEALRSNALALSSRDFYCCFQTARKRTT